MPGPATTALFRAFTDPEAPVPRAMLVVAHPDDEIVSVGARLPRLHRATVVYVTDGAPREGSDAATHGLSVPEYAQARKRERAAALALCGFDPRQLRDLDAPDQESALQLPALSEKLAELLAQEQPQVLIAHAYEGGHPDHDASAFIAHAAVALLQARGLPAPELVEMTSYHWGPKGLEAGRFLPRGAVDDEALRFELSEEEHAFKRSLVAQHVTQTRTLSHLPLDVECFRPAPAYDFTRRAHEGPLNYERHPWGMDGAKFTRLTAQALAQLGLQGPL